MDDFEIELRAGFLEEASQGLADAEHCFLSLERTPDDPAILEQIFRIAHNLKGSAKAVGFDELGAFTHELESLLLKLKNREIPVQEATVDLLLRCNDHLLHFIATLKKDHTSSVDSDSLLVEIRQHINGEVKVEIHSAPSVRDPFEAHAPAVSQAVNTFGKADTTALVAASQGNFEEDTEELEFLDPAMQAEHQAAGVPEVSAPVVAQPNKPAATVIPIASAQAAAKSPEAAKKPEGETKKAGGGNSDETVRVSLGRLEKLLNFVGEMVILQAVLREQAVGSNSPLMRKTVHQLGKVTKEVQDISMGLRMVPLKQTFQKMQRIVRDTAGQLNKKVELKLIGEETEVDKTVLEHLGDPLVHLIRNACDHGIESPEARIEKGKPAQGEVILNAFHQSGNLVIEIKDNGGGIDPERLKKKAFEKGLLKPGTQLTEREAVNLVFHPGFSTKDVVTDVSGRGVGMDVVKTNIEKLQGDIQIETELGKGTTFKIRLPLTLAIIDGMVIRSESDRFIIPLSHVHESVRPAAKDVQKNTGLGEVLMLRGENLPMYRLQSLLGRNGPGKDASECIAIVVRTLEKPFAVLVDDIIGQQQVVIKSLGPEVQHLKGFSGSAILGDGRPSLILEVGELIKKGPVGPTSNRSNKELRRATV